MTISELMKGISCSCLQGSMDREMTTLVYDSRKMEKGSVFVCISGLVSDGHSYVAQAAEKGAAAVIVEKDVEVDASVTVLRVENTRLALAQTAAAYFGHPARELITIGITGTKGKTTTTYMIRDMLEHAGHPTGLMGTIETIIGETRTPACNTTPESYIVQETFRKMVDAGCKCVVMEVSSQALMMHRVSGFTFDYGVFTNLGVDHIGEGEHADFEDYKRCKALLFRQCKHGILNGDDAYVKDMLVMANCTTEFFTIAGKNPAQAAQLLKEDNCLRAADVRLVNKGGSLGVAYHLDGLLDMDVEIDIPGSFSVYNSLAALAVARCLGTEEALMKASLKHISVRGRVELQPVSPHFSVMIDYAHNAMSLESLLTTLREYAPKRLVCVFGCGGNRSRDRRFLMGEVSARLADLTIITSDNPRYEEPEEIIADIVVGAKKGGGAYVTVTDRGEAIAYAIENAKEGDVIVVAGKGHEDYQEIRGKKYPMDDRALIAAAKRPLNF